MENIKSRVLKFAILCSSLLFACTNNQPATKQDAVTVQIDTAQPPLSVDTSKPDTLIVYRKAAVFYEPDSAQIAKRKKAVGEDDFDAGVEDYAYYLNEAHDFLESARLPMLNAGSKKYLQFVSNNKSSQFIKLDTLPQLWGICFFEPGKKIKEVDMTMIETEYNNYFK